MAARLWPTLAPPSPLDPRPPSPLPYLERALRKPGCPLCRRIREAERWIWNVLYELTGDPEIHARFAAPWACAGNTRPSWPRWWKLGS
ncbi:MAG: hypothetical protein ABDI20_09575 [Candidatus Bipolaricaulaceae bacterium]